MGLSYDSKLDCELFSDLHKGINYKAPRLLADRYEIDGILAAGGMGVLFVAKDKKANYKKVLIKRAKYDPTIFKYRNDVSRERQIKILRKKLEMEYAVMLHGWARRIPNIPVPLDLVKGVNPEIYGPHVDNNTNEEYYEEKLHENELYLVLKYFTGDVIKEDSYCLLNKNLWKKCCKCLGVIANILGRFHTPYISTDENGKETRFEFYYCDLKPDNILITDDSKFGANRYGKLLSKEGWGKFIANDVTTTPGYRAPELIGSSVNFVSEAADIYSLAITVFELISQKSPIENNGDIELDWDAFKTNVKAEDKGYLVDVFKKGVKS